MNPNGPTVLRIRFATSLGVSILRGLHRDGLDTSSAREVGQVLRARGVRQITPVHNLSDKEIDSDRYGFARDFKVLLDAEIEAGSAMEDLRSLEWVESIRPVFLRRGTSGRG